MKALLALFTVALLLALSAASANAAPAIFPFGYSISDPEPGGDGDGYAEPTESFDLKLGLTNNAGSTLTHLGGTLSTTSQNVTIDQATANWPNIPYPESSIDPTPFRVTAAPALPCDNKMEFKTAATSDQVSTDVYHQVPVGHQQEGEAFPSAAIPDNNPTGASSTINLPVDITGAVQLGDVNVQVIINHTFNADLDLYLTHGSTTVPLFTGVGSSNDGFSVTLDDQASTAIENAPAPTQTVIGTYRPETPTSMNAAFAGQPAAGDWTLKVVDHAGGDTGIFYTWYLYVTNPCNRSPLTSFTTSPSPPTSAQQTSLNSTSQDFDGTITNQAWDLDNDGAYDDGSGPTVARTFDPGTYTVGLKATDNAGATDTTTQNVTIADKSAPKLTLSGAKTQSNANGVTVTVTSDEAATVALGGKVNVPKGASRALKLKAKSFSLKANAKTKLKLSFAKKVKRAVKKALRKRKKPSVSLTLSAKDALGNQSTAKRTIKIKVRKKQRR